MAYNANAVERVLWFRYDDELWERRGVNRATVARLKRLRDIGEMNCMGGTRANKTRRRLKTRLAGLDQGSRWWRHDHREHFPSIPVVASENAVDPKPKNRHQDLAKRTATS
jgi:hypothetical protein